MTGGRDYSMCRYLDLSNNALTGSLSTAMVYNGYDDPLYQLSYLDLHHNQLSGTLSDDVLNGLSALTYVLLWSELDT